jgi:hypothetical protein
VLLITCNIQIKQGHHNRDFFFARGTMLRPRFPGPPNGYPRYPGPAEIGGVAVRVGIETYTTNSAGPSNICHLPERQTLPADSTYFFIPGDLLAKILLSSDVLLDKWPEKLSLLPLSESPCAVGTFSSSKDSCEGPVNPGDHTGSKK